MLEATALPAVLLPVIYSLKLAIPGLFSFILQTPHTILQQTNMKNIQSSIWHWDSNSAPHGQESYLITTTTVGIQPSSF